MTFSVGVPVLRHKNRDLKLVGYLKGALYELAIRQGHFILNVPCYSGVLTVQAQNLSRSNGTNSSNFVGIVVDQSILKQLKTSGHYHHITTIGAGVSEE